MPTAGQIIDWVNRYYPNIESTANKLIDLDQIHKSVYEKIIRQKNITSMFTDYTIADQYTYTFISDCKPDNIFKILVSDTVTSSIDENTKWQEYQFADLGKDVESGYYWTPLTRTTYILIKDGLPLPTSDWEIRIYYYNSPVSITLTTQTPTLDEEYHDLLKYALVQMLASEGDNPDTEVANYYQLKYQERFNEITDSMAERRDATPVEPEVWGSRW